VPIAATAQAPVEEVEQQRPVGQTGEWIVQRLMGQLGLGSLERRDVPTHDEDVLDLAGVTSWGTALDWVPEGLGGVDHLELESRRSPDSKTEATARASARGP